MCKQKRGGGGAVVLLFMRREKGDVMSLSCLWIVIAGKVKKGLFLEEGGGVLGLGLERRLGWMKHLRPGLIDSINF